MSRALVEVTTEWQQVLTAGGSVFISKVGSGGLLISDIEDGDDAAMKLNRAWLGKAIPLLGAVWVKADEDGQFEIATDTTKAGGVLVDNAGNMAEIDALTGYLVGIATEHHKIHEEAHFASQDYDGDVDAAKYWLFETADSTTLAHFIFTIRTSLSGTLEFFEGVTYDTKGTALDIYNNCRSSSDEAIMSAYKDPTVVVDGDVRLAVQSLGTDGSGPSAGIGGIGERSQELILKPNTSYAIKYTPEDDNNRVSICMDFYEQAPQA